MSIFLGILLTLVILLIVVMIHELGHFVTARLTGMRVEEFGIGIPPRAKSLFVDKKGTEYTLNYLPIGWFVRILGEDTRDPNAHKKWAFITKPWISRVIVLAAWVFMNFVLAFVVFTGLFLYGVTPMAIIPLEWNHSQILPSTHEALDASYLHHDGLTLTPIVGSISEKSGVLSGDIIENINGVVPKVPQDIINIIQKNIEVTVLIKRWTETKNITMLPKDGKVGMQIGYKNLNINKDFIVRYTWIDAIKAWWNEMIANTRITYSFLERMVAGLFSPNNKEEHQAAKEMLSGPIGLGSTFVSIVQNNMPISIILVMVALLSINLWVVNILPFPALDGGRIVTTTLYALIAFIPWGKTHFARIEWMVHTVWFLLLIGLMIYVSGLDILRFF